MADNYDSLLAQLKQETEWPRVFLFKFIIPNENKTLALAEALFTSEAQVSIRESRNKNYLSLTAKELMLNPEEIVDRYKRAANIKGLIAL